MAMKHRYLFSFTCAAAAAVAGPGRPAFAQDPAPGPAAAQTPAPAKPSAEPQPAPTPPPAPTAPPPVPSPVPEAPPATPQPTGAQSFTYEKGRLEKDGTVTIFYRVGHGRGKMMVPILQKYLSPPPKGWIHENEGLHILIVSDVKENIDLLDTIVKLLDVAEPQVMIDAKIVEVIRSKDQQLGIDGLYERPLDSASFFRSVGAAHNTQDFLNSLLPGSSPFQGSTFRFASSDERRGTVTATIRALVDRGDAEIISNPRIMVHSGEEAMVQSTEKTPYVESTFVPNTNVITVNTKFEVTGITLKVTPHIVSTNQISMLLEPEVSTVTGFVTVTGGGQVPLSSIRKSKTEVTVRDSQEVVIGGLIKKVKRKDIRGVPFLSDIPILGWFFSNHEDFTQEIEVIFIIKPSLIRGGTDLPKEMIDPMRTLKKTAEGAPK